jgi:hypothetical protein
MPRPLRLLAVALLTSVIAGAALSSGPGAGAQAPPRPPHRFFGTATLNGAPAPVGTTVEALMGGAVCGTGQTNSAGQYVLDVNQPGAPAACGRVGDPITFRVGGVTARETAVFREGGYEQLNLTASGAAGFTVAALNLSDPRPCIPEPGQRTCSAFRAALWNGEAAAWAELGVTDPDARFNETVVFRVRAGDPAVISIIARFLGGPYLQVTRVKFVGSEPGQVDEYVEVANLGGGPQEMTGWSVSSPQRNKKIFFPNGYVMQPGQSCRIYTGAPRENSCGTASFNDTDVWPDSGGRVVLYYDALDLLGADTQYSADPNNQPPPPNLQGVS